MGLLKHSDFSQPQEDEPSLARVVSSGVVNDSGVLKGIDFDSRHRVVVPSVHPKQMVIPNVPVDVPASDASSKPGTPDIDATHANLDAYDLDMVQSQELSSSAVGLSESEVKEREKAAYQEGYDAAKAEMAEDMAKKAADFEEAFVTLATERDKALASAQEGILNLSIRIAEKMLGAQLTANRSNLKSVLDEAFQKISSSDKVVIRANPADVPFARSVSQEFEQKFSSIRSVSVEEDHSLSEGSCILETDYGFVDARIPMKVSILTEAFKKVLLTDES